MEGSYVHSQDIAVPASKVQQMTQAVTTISLLDCQLLLELTAESTQGYHGLVTKMGRQLAKVKPTPVKPTLESKTILTASEAAQLIGVHVNTVRRWNTAR